MSFTMSAKPRVPRGSVQCLKQIAVDKKGSTKSMSNHLTSCHNERSSEKLTRNNLTAAVSRFLITSNIPYQVVDHEDFTELLRLCNPLAKSLLKSKFNYDLKSMVLAAKLVEGNHSGVTLATHLAEILESYNLNNHIFFLGSFCCYSNHSPKLLQTALMHTWMAAWLEHAECQLQAVEQVLFVIQPLQGLSAIFNHCNKNLLNYLQLTCRNSQEASVVTSTMLQN
ncbi:uncharacterized protein VP01_1111g6 [Puccinia sorghi]|uniref:Uncharacterized protein n=1 Tax=Puccinia sorghi TaxID=27349 RepID=A0A0L6VU16_9BASI|nr:uncharacterized protein VP01_1111g6 [Puccinia sorghi]